MAAAPAPAELRETALQFLTYLTQAKGKSVAELSCLSEARLRTVYNLEFKHGAVRMNGDGKGALPLISFGDLHTFMLKERVWEQGLNMKMMTPASSGEFRAPGPVPAAVPTIDRKPQQKQSAIDFTSYDVDVLSFGTGGFQRDLVKSHADEHRPAILFAMGTNLSARINWNVFEIRGYDTFRQDTQDGKGGILVYVKNRLDVVHLEDLESGEFEAIWLKLTHPDLMTNAMGEKEKVVTIVGNVYRSSSEKPIGNFYKYIKECIIKVLRRNPDAHILIQGSFNWKSAQDYEGLTEMLQSGLSVQNVGTDRPVSYVRSSGLKNQPVITKGPPTSSAFGTKIKRLFCSYCKEGLLTEDQLENHRRTLRHRRNFCYVSYLEKRSDLISSKFGMNFYPVRDAGDSGDFSRQSRHDPTNGLYEIKALPGTRVEIKINLRNDSSDENVILKSVEILGEADADIELKDGYGITKPVEMREEKLKPGVRILPSRQLAFAISFCKPHIGQFRVPVLAQMKADKGTEGLKHMVLELVIKIVTADMDDLGPTSPYEPPIPISKKWASLSERAEPGMRVAFEGKKLSSTPKVPLLQYGMTRELQKIMRAGFKASNNLTHNEKLSLVKYKEMMDEGLTSQNYSERFKLLLYCEENQMEVDIRNYDMENVEMKREPDGYLYLTVPGLAENRPSVLKGDRLYVCESANPTKSFEGYVHEVLDTRVKLGFSNKLLYYQGMRFNVQFTFNRFPMKTMHRAVAMMREAGLVDAVFPRNPKLISTLTKTPDNFINKAIGQNQEQKIAVTQIVSGNLIGAPYIIFGPPGTGKTVTIVEAMKQIYKRDNVNCRILASAPSNSAADLIAKRLLDTVAPSDILRLYAESRALAAVPADTFAISNFNEKVACRKVEDVMKFKVVVVTLVNAGRLVTMGVPRGHFQHIFLDEAGHAPEPEALVPLSGLLDPSTGHFVLAGDPKQLGPILRSPIALANGLHVSLLERIMENPKLACYQKDASSHHFDTCYITKLLDNFRSHGSLLSLPSKLFYDSELRAKADPMVVNSLLQWEGLPRKGFPMLFHSVVGVDQRESRSPSFFNAEEVVIVVKHLEDLLTSPGKSKVAGRDIGIITPYRRQVQKIRELMNKKFQKTKLDWRDVTVGSTEEFQGQERRVILISTVRSKEEFLSSDMQHKLGFLKNPKRFNVAITRAKALMIVVGNPNLLKMDPNWKQLIDYAFLNGGYTGSVKYQLTSAADDDNSSVDALEEKLREIGLGDANSVDESSFEVISQMELQEAPEWRADF